MNWKAIGIASLLFDFTALTLYTLVEVSFAEMSALILSSPATITLAVDLVIALGLAAVWISVDARARGVSSAPYILLTLTLGSIGPLVYLFRRELASSRHPAVATAAA